MLQTKIMEIQQAKRLGIKFTPKNMFTRTVKTPDGRVHKAGDTIDPNIANRILVDWWIDTLGITLGVLVPGFRAHNPVNAAIIKPLSFLAQIIVSGQTPDDWDLKDWIFGIASFWVGLGYTLPVQVIANISGYFDAPIPILTDDRAKDKSLLSNIVPVNPRVAQFGIQALDGFFNAPQYSRRSVSAGQYDLAQLEKFLLSFNAFTPIKRSYFGKETAKFQARGPVQKVGFFLEEGRFLKYLVPIYNITDANKN